jgi:hypothetical protein
MKSRASLIRRTDAAIKAKSARYCSENVRIAILGLIVLVALIGGCVWLVRWLMDRHEREQALWRQTIERAAGSSNLRREPSWAAPDAVRGLDAPAAAPEGFVWVLVPRAALPGHAEKTDTSR